MILLILLLVPLVGLVGQTLSSVNPLRSAILSQLLSLRDCPTVFRKS